MPRLDIAVVGMAALFPGARDLASFRSNIRAGHDAISEVPPGRWDPAFYDPASGAADRLYCRRGGFIDAFATFDPVAFGVMPVAARGAEPDQLLALDVASRALADAGYDHRSFARDRAGVVLGRGNYAGAGRTRLEQHIRAAEQLVTCLRSLVPGIGDDELARVKKEFQAQLPAAGAEVAIGLVPNLTASRIAHRLDLTGPAFTIDAACASSLVAIDQACRELASGRVELMLAGGVHVCHDETFWSVFCQLGALSRSQSIRPFDRRADGLLIGEGIGVVVLKRRADAERDDDRIYAIVRGTGIASDGHETSLVAPRVEGQVLALERAWREACVDPATIGLLEAHGTATPAGDAAELETLRRVFGAAPHGSPRAAVGSVKSMIGHAMPAAGVAGFIKAVLALDDRVLPPTLHCEEPSPRLEATRFRALSSEEPWESGQPRRAAVNAFGFGGINAHVVLEEHASRHTPRARATDAPSEAPSIALFGAATPAELAVALERGREGGRGGSGSARLAVLEPTAERLARAREIVGKGKPWRGRDGIWFAPSGLLAEGGKLALLFPGVDASFEPRVDDVAARFGVPVPSSTKPTNLEELGFGIIGVNRLLSEVLTELSVGGDFVAGHSIGEWSGMIASGMIPEQALEEFISSLRPGSLEVPGVAFAAAGCSVEAARAAIRDLPEIDISHDNCPHQILICGRDESVDIALTRLRAAGVLSQKLPFRSGFHSRLFADYLDLHRAHFARLPLVAPRVPLWSATTCARYPEDAEGIRRLALEHLVRPVRFRELIEALYAAGARVFVQVGTGSLVQFVEDTLRGRPHVAITANSRDRSGLDQLRRLAAALFVEGGDVRLSTLFASTATEREPLRLALGVPLVRLSTPLSLSAAAPSAAKSAASGPLAAEFAASLAAVSRAQTDVLAALDRRTQRAEREAVTVTTLSVPSMPELRDHSFFRQPPGWTALSDLHPVVPMTTSIELMKEAAERLVPGRKVIALEDVRAYRWIIVSTPLEVRIRARHDGGDRVSVSIEEYAEATCVLGAVYPPAPPADTEPLADAERAPQTARQLYDDRWMFHGPAFQGVVDVGVLGSSGIRGEIATPSAKGALLDNAGQLFGYWVMRKSEKDRLAMPVRIQRLSLFGPHPGPGERVVCTARVTRFGPKEVVANLSLDRGGQAWARIEGWEDRRFDTDDRLWAVMLYPEKNLLSEPQPGGYVLLTDRYRSAPTRDQLARRFLGEKERAECDAQGPRRQRSWLAGRIAAKDAVRDLLWKNGVGTLYPVEITVETLPNGRPKVHAPFDGVVRVSIAHKDDLAVAIASVERDVGIDIERVDARPEGFTELAFSEGELGLMARSENRDEWLTKLWAAKEASSKAEGVGLSGDPRRFPVTDRATDRLLCAGRWVELRRFGDYVIGWTVT
jgi:acyl transferase domain-containing protein